MEKASEGEIRMEKSEREGGNLQLDKALAVIWNEIHCLHDDIEFMMDLIRNVNELVDLQYLLQFVPVPQPLPGPCIRETP